MITETMTDTTVRLLNHLHRGGTYRYFWLNPSKRTIWQRGDDELPDIDALASTGQNVYFGVHPTFEIPAMNKDGEPVEPEKVRGRKENIAAINALFAEFDAKQEQFKGSKEAALAHINALPVQPSVIIDSGGGYHCYWLLKETCTIDNDSDREDAQRLETAWVGHVGGDPGAKDIARLLRVPDTMNYKYSPARQVEFVRADFDIPFTMSELVNACRHILERKPVEVKLVVVDRPRRSGSSDLVRAQAYADKCVDAVRAAMNGSRNDTLNKSSFSVGQLMPYGLNRSEYESALISAALSAGLPHKEAVATVRSGLTKGEKEPRVLEDREYTPRDVAVYDMPVRTHQFDVNEEATSGVEAGSDDTTTAPIAHKGYKSEDLVKALQWLGYSFRYNLLRDLIEVNGEQLTDVLAAKIYVQLFDLGFNNQKLIDSVMLAEAGKHTHHPIKDYLSGLTWDGTPRIDKLASCFVDDHEQVCDYRGNLTTVIRLYLRRWLVGAVAKVLGNHQNVMLVLAGLQGIGKSTFCQRLASGIGMDYFIEEQLNPDSRDSEINHIEKFIWEVGELGATTKRRDIEAVKSFITKSQITVRRPYGHYSVTRQAMSAFIGTVNGDGGGFLNDSTGSRRFMVVKLKSIDMAYMELDINQVWAEAVHLYRSGEPFALTDSERQIREELNAEHQMVDPYEEWVRKWFIIDPTTTEVYLSVTDIYAELVNRGALAQTGNQQTVIASLGRTLKSIGVERKQKRIGGEKPWVYVGIRKKAHP